MHDAQVDEALRRATIAVLRERGWEGLTLARVAGAAGRARSTLWRQGLTREVLVAKGYEVIRIETQGPDQIVWYRAGNQGRGRGKGPPQRMIIRRVENRIVFVDTPSAFLVDIDLRLRL